jgi:hypothetical protein
MKTIEDYHLVNGTAYHKETDGKIIEILEKSRRIKERLIFDFGDTKTGKSWNEEFDTTGHIGRSTGKIQIPLLIKQVRSSGGGGLLDHCIVKITTSKGKKVLYQHPNYNK